MKLTNVNKKRKSKKCLLAMLLAIVMAFMSVLATPTAALSYPVPDGAAVQSAETLARQASEEQQLTATLGETAGLQGFDGDLTLDNPSEVVEIIVQFVTPPAVALRLIAERGIALPADFSASGATFEEQALSAHITFGQQLLTIPVPHTGQPPVTLIAHHQLFNGVVMRVTAEMAALIAELPEVFAVTPHIIPVLEITATTDDTVIFPEKNVAPADGFFNNPNLMRTARDLFEIDYIHTALGITGAGIRVGMIDSGIDYTHPEFVRFLDETGSMPGWQYYAHDDSPGAHGTMTAGSIIAMAPEVELWSFRRISSNADGSIHSGLWAIEALEAAWGRDMDVIYTWGDGGWSPFSAFASAITMAVLDGIVVVVAAHNFGPGNFTVLGGANSPPSIAVGAGWAGNDIAIWDVHLWNYANFGIPIPSSGTDTIANFSGRGPTEFTYHIKPDIIGPGIDGISTTANGGYALFGGTSMAGPTITGIAALLVQAFPNAEPWEIKARMMNNGRPMIDLPAETVFTSGAGFVRPLEAIQGMAFATVEQYVPKHANPGLPFEMGIMSSLNFGIVTSHDGNTMAVTIHNHNDDVWTHDVQFNGSGVHTGAEFVITQTAPGVFEAEMIFASGTPFGMYEGNLIFSNGLQSLRLPFAAMFTADITDDFVDPILLAAVRQLTGLPVPFRIHAHNVSGITQLNLTNLGITDMSGIGHFIALNTLRVDHNYLTDPADVADFVGTNLIFWPQRGNLPANVMVEANYAYRGNVSVRGELWASGLWASISTQAATGFAFEYWQVIDGDVTIADATATSTIFAVPDTGEDVLVQAVFRPLVNPRTITPIVNAPGMGTITASTWLAEAGATIDIWINATHGNQIDSRYIDVIGVVLELIYETPTQQHLRFVMPDEDVVFSAHFVQRLWAAAVGNIAGGAMWIRTTEPSSAWVQNSMFVEEGDVVSIAAPLSGFVGWDAEQGGVTLLGERFDANFAYIYFVMLDEIAVVRALYEWDLLVGQPPVITHYDVPNGMIGEIFGHNGGGFRFFSQGGGTILLSILGYLPPGLVFNPFTGILSGTPTQGGVFDNFTIRAENQYGYQEIPLSITIGPLFGLQIFNNGNNNNQSLANAGLIRMWMQLDGASVPVPYAQLDVTATLPSGDCAMDFVRVNRIWNNMDYVNLIDVNKHAAWQTIYFTATLFGQTIDVVLINNMYFSMRAFNNGTCDEVPSMTGNIRIWTMLNGIGTPIPMNAVITAIDQDGNDASHLIMRNRLWCDILGWQPYYVNFDVSKLTNWEAITFSVTVFGQSVTILLVNNLFEIVPIFDMIAFNNGTCDEVPDLAGMIRIWTILDGIGTPIPMNAVIIAIDQDGNDVSHLITRNRLWCDILGWQPYYVNFDVSKLTNWETITFSVTVFGQNVQILLINNLA